jgi:hypothetical protein
MGSIVRQTGAESTGVRFGRGARLHGGALHALQGEEERRHGEPTVSSRGGESELRRIWNLEGEKSEAGWGIFCVSPALMEVLTRQILDYYCFHFVSTGMFPY